MKIVAQAHVNTGFTVLIKMSKSSCVTKVQSKNKRADGDSSGKEERWLQEATKKKPVSMLKSTTRLFQVIGCDKSHWRLQKKKTRLSAGLERIPIDMTFKIEP